MALGPPCEVVEDTPSEIVRVSRLELNKVMTALDTLATELEGAASFGDAQTAITNTLVPLLVELRQVLVSYNERPAPPKAPLTPGA